MRSLRKAEFHDRKLAWVLTVVAGAAACTSADAGRIEVGHTVPEYSAVSLAGDSVSLTGMRGRVVLLNVWATWCHPCRDEIPELREIQTRYQGQPFDVVGVSVDAEGAESLIGAFIEEFGMNYPIWLDPEDRVSTRFLLVGVPTTFLIDKQGVLRWRKTGPVEPGDTTLTSLIDKALAE